MQSRWSDDDARRMVDAYGARWGEDLALRTYTSRLLGSEPSLVLHGGGNTSVKGEISNVFGDRIPAVFVKASGRDMAGIEPDGHPAVDLHYLRQLRALPDLSDEAMANELRTHLFDHRSPTPSLETLVHAFLPGWYIDHTHADAILTLTNQVNGADHVRDALGDQAIIVDYVTPGFQLARAAADAFEAHPDGRSMVWMRHGIVTWGDTAREAYETMIDLVSRAETYAAARASRTLHVDMSTSIDVARERLARVAPVIRGLLCRGADASDVRRPVVVCPLVDQGTLAFVDSREGRTLALTAPITSDHLIRTRPLPLWIGDPRYDDDAELRRQVAGAIRDYEDQYRGYVARHHADGAGAPAVDDARPRVILMPGLGALCAAPDAEAATVARDITAHTLAVKERVASMGGYLGVPERDLFKMEFRAFQQAKLREARAPLGGHVALVTGAAGAIGAGICQALLANGCLVAATDLAGDRLASLVADTDRVYASRIIGIPLDVTDPASVAAAFQSVVTTWGGVDLVIINAGIGLVSSLAEMDLAAFRRLEQVNVEGTLTVLAESGRHFSQQACGGDIVLVSTKNVFSPGARFGAYSATKAASHQLARIASLEFADLDVRVNMVAPDAVFSHGSRKSGLWAEVGPDRMKARGLDEAGLEEYYRTRNLLKARVTADHVANAVLFFATRRTPTTGATIPVDGGLPDATPR
jgi:rhamnose utilization protein RhaD (predicted bifunctional aldolase and dehydrogenase)/NAD(P)-dependent dehydrogenase (short-subunit alcohol dehydrogenase family)